MKLWEVATGKCLYTWEFPTAVKRVAFSEDDLQIVCVTEQRMGFQCAIRIFNVNREGDGRDRECSAIAQCIGFNLDFRVGGCPIHIQPHRVQGDRSHIRS